MPPTFPMAWPLLERRKTCKSKGKVSPQRRFTRVNHSSPERQQKWGTGPICHNFKILPVLRLPSCIKFLSPPDGSGGPSCRHRQFCVFATKSTVKETVDQRTLADRSPPLLRGVVAPMEEIRLQTMAAVMALVKTAVSALEAVEAWSPPKGVHVQSRLAPC